MFTSFLDLYIYLCLLIIQNHYFEKSAEVMYFIIYLKEMGESVKKTHFGDSCSDDLVKKTTNTKTTLNEPKLNIQENKN